MDKIKIILADDHNLVRQGFRQLLESYNKYEVIAEASTGKEVLKLISRTSPNLIILDYSMPEMNGIEITEQIKNIDKNIKILILTMYDNETIILDGIGAGINGFLYKEAEMDELILAIDTIMAGSDYFSEGVKEKIISFHTYRKSEKFYELTKSKIPLTKREIEIIANVAQGYNSYAIGEKLFISSYTVVKHRKNILKKLHMKNFAEVVNFAKDNNII